MKKAIELWFERETTHRLSVGCSNPCCGIPRPFGGARLCSVASMGRLQPARIKHSYVEYVVARFFEPCKEGQNRPVEPNPPSPRSVSPNCSIFTSLNTDLGIGVISSWAILSPLAMVYELPSPIQVIITNNSPR